jgi:hypothetical protein
LVRFEGIEYENILGTLIAVLTLSTGYAFAGVDDEVKATFDRFVAAQNAHDVSAVRDLLLIHRISSGSSRCADLGRDAALKRFETMYQGPETFSRLLEPESRLVKRHNGTVICPNNIQYWTTGAGGV